MDGEVGDGCLAKATLPRFMGLGVSDGGSVDGEVGDGCLAKATLPLSAARKGRALTGVNGGID